MQNFCMEINTVKPKIMAFRETEPIRRNTLMISGIHLFYSVLYTCSYIFESLYHIQGISFLRTAHQLTYTL